MISNIIVFIFPLILIGIEFLLRLAFDANIKDFVGPTLASAGICFMVQLTKSKKYELKDASGNTYVACKSSEVSFVNLMWLLMVFSLVGWCFSYYAATKMPNDTIIGFSTHVVVGGIIYIISLTGNLFKWVFYE